MFVKKLDAWDVHGSTSYFPEAVRGLHLNLSKRRSKWFYLYGYRDHLHSITVITHPVSKNRYRRDAMFQNYLEHSGIDTKALLKMYSLTPASVQSVYLDFYKYLMPINHIFKMTDNKLVAKEMLCKWKNQSTERARLLNYDEVLPFLDRTTSATALFNRVYKNKGEVIDSPEFEESYITFVMKVLMDEDYMCLWTSCQKEEIRDTEKVSELKIRSFIIGSIYALILNHQVNLEGDLIMSKNWKKLRIGMGMSLFQRDYDYMFRRIRQRLHHGFLDVSKWDSRMDHEVKAIEVDAHSTMYNDRYVTLRNFLGDRMYAKAKRMGYKNIMVDVLKVRHKLIRDETMGPIIMPHGELVFKKRGKNSGDGRTTSQNTGVHKFYEFETCVNLYGPEKAVNSQGWIEDWKIGDDQTAGFDDPKYFLESIKTLKSYGYEVTGKECKFDELEFISTTPVQIKVNTGEVLYVPKTNSSKIVTALLDKRQHNDPLIDFARLMSAIVLCFFTEDYQPLLITKKLFLVDFPQFHVHKMNKTHEQILSLYVGQYETSGSEFSFFSDLLPHINDLLGESLNL